MNDHRTESISRGLPMRNYDADTNLTRIPQVVKDYDKDFDENINLGTGICVYGDTGTGKTQSLTWLIKSRGFVPFIFLLPHEIVSVSFEDEYWEWLCDTCRLVVLDDLDKISLTNKDNQYSIQKIYELIYRRIDRNCLPTWATWNGDIQSLGKIYGEWSVRRLLEGSGRFVARLKK